MQSPPPAVFHYKAKRTQQGNLLTLHTPGEFFSPSPHVRGGPHILPGWKHPASCFAILNMAEYLLPSICNNLVWLYSNGIYFDNLHLDLSEKRSKGLHIANQIFPCSSKDLQHKIVQNWSKFFHVLSYLHLWTRKCGSLQRWTWILPSFLLKIIKLYHFPMQTTFRCKQERWTWILPSHPFLWATCTQNCLKFYHFQMQTTFRSKQERWTWILPSLPFLWATCTQNCSKLSLSDATFSCKQERWTWILPSLPFLWATPRRMFLSMLIKNRGLVDITFKIPWSLFVKK